MKEAVTKFIDTVTQVDFHGAFQKLLERYNKCIAAGGDYFEEDKSFVCVLSIKYPYEKSQETYRMLTSTTPIDFYAIVIYMLYLYAIVIYSLSRFLS